jgi:hypothetical protein
LGKLFVRDFRRVKNTWKLRRTLIFSSEERYKRCVLNSYCSNVVIIFSLLVLKFTPRTPLMMMRIFTSHVRHFFFPLRDSKFDESSACTSVFAFSVGPDLTVETSYWNVLIGCKTNGLYCIRKPYLNICIYHQICSLC